MVMPTPPAAIIFDLDGTLIDSAPSILESFRLVLDEAGLAPQVPLDATLIGPPLRQTLMQLTSLPMGEGLERLASSFQQIYDEAGYKETLVYTGVEELLDKCATSRVPLAIATNKRRAPTVKILAHLGWDRYFSRVGTIDGLPAGQAHKVRLLASIVEEMKIPVDASVYVGDKWEDGEAAVANGLNFIAAGWGYGNWASTAMPGGWLYAEQPSQIMRLAFRLDEACGALR